MLLHEALNFVHAGESRDASPEWAALDALAAYSRLALKVVRLGKAEIATDRDPSIDAYQQALHALRDAIIDLDEVP